MTDSSTPAPEDKPPSVQPLAGKTVVLGLDYKTAGLLAYLPICAINLILSIVWLQTEPKENRFLRFHALQSALMCGAYIVLGVIVWFITLIVAMIPFLNFFLSKIVGLFWLVVTVVFIWMCIRGMIDAYRGGATKIAFVGDLAEQSL